MEILITNDDGIQSKGIALLTQIMTKLGHVTVVAPDGARSGQSNAITVTKMVRLQKVSETPAVALYSCSGTPSDCVKMALCTIYGDKKPDLVVSGVNHGNNSSICVIYSGTMGATFVAAENGIPAIGYSLYDHHADADFQYFEPYIEEITRKLMSVDTPYGTVYNVNAPVGPIKGVRLARQAQGHFEKEWKQYEDPSGKPFYLITGTFVNHEPDARDSDEYLLTHGYVTIVPTTIDMTDYSMLKSLENQDW